MHTFTDRDEVLPKPGNIIKPEFCLQLQPTTTTASDYLEALLRADSRKGNFHSFYSHQKSAHDAEIIVAAFLGHISKGNELQLYILEPDFLLVSPADMDCLYYFEGMGCDNAALISAGTFGYLLLTNGIP